MPSGTYLTSACLQQKGYPPPNLRSNFREHIADRRFCHNRELPEEAMCALRQRRLTLNDLKKSKRNHAWGSLWCSLRSTIDTIIKTGLKKEDNIEKSSTIYNTAGPFDGFRFVAIDETLSTYKEFFQKYGQGGISFKTYFQVDGR